MTVNELLRELNRSVFEQEVDWKTPEVSLRVGADYLHDAAKYASQHDDVMMLHHVGDALEHVAKAVAAFDQKDAASQLDAIAKRFERVDRSSVSEDAKVSEQQVSDWRILDFALKTMATHIEAAQSAAKARDEAGVHEEVGRMFTMAGSALNAMHRLDDARAAMEIGRNLVQLSKTERADSISSQR